MYNKVADVKRHQSHEYDEIISKTNPNDIDYLTATVTKYNDENVDLVYIPNTSKEQFEKNKKQQLKEIVDTYKDSGLQNAFDNTSVLGREVMFKCKYYYWINIDIGGDIINPLEEMGLN